MSSYDNGTSSKLRVSERNETLFQLPNGSSFAFVKCKNAKTQNYKNKKGTQNVPFNEKNIACWQSEEINYVLLCMAINLWTDK